MTNICAGSVAFNTDPISKINELINKNIDPRLFLAAYYAPKHLSDSAPEYVFWCAVTNVYGLFRDCANFIDRGDHYSLLQVMSRDGLISEADRTQIARHISLICDLRSIFCHNISDQFSADNHQFQKLISFLQNDLGLAPAPKDLPYRIDLEEKDWETALSYICAETDSCLSLLEKGIVQIRTKPNRADIIDNWLTGIALWYENHGSLIYRTAHDYYSFMGLQNGRRVGNRKKCVTTWLKNYQPVWRKQYLSEMKLMNEPALPLETTWRILQKANPVVY